MIRSLFSRILVVIAAFSLVTPINAQTRVRPLPSNINRPSVNLYAPFVSGDGQTMVYLSDYTDDGHHGMRWATKKTVSTWNDGREVTKLINRPSLNYRGGYSLSFDGDLLLFTSRKSGLGGYDVWYSKKSGDDWSAPKNYGMPINSPENEGAPVLSPDGEYLYFMRCAKMSEYSGAGDCKLMVAKRSYNGWEEPKPLPDNINTGNSQTPRILADGETLVFASDQLGGKGGLDLYMSTHTGNTWSDPIALEFINTEQDDQFISVPAKGRYLYADVQGRKDRELAEILIPGEFQPKKVMRIQGLVTDAETGEPVNANLTVFDIGMRDRLWNEKVGAKGEFAIVLKEGSVYDVNVESDDNSYMFFSKLYDLREMDRDKDKLDIRLKPLAENIQYPIDIYFKKHSSELSDDVTFELRRIGEMLRKNPGMTIEIEVNQNNYVEDSIQSDPDLTETRIDSIYHSVDSLSREAANFDSLSLEDINFDSLEMEYITEDTLKSRDTFTPQSESDTAVTLEYEDDSLTTNSTNDLMESDSSNQILELKYTYHNDRTEQQAKAIRNYLVGRGVDGERVRVKISRSEPKVEEVTEEGDVKDDNSIIVTMTILKF